MKTVIEVIDAILAEVHKELGTSEGFDLHPQEVSDDEKLAIAERIHSALVPQDMQKPSGDPKADDAGKSDKEPNKETRAKN